MPLSQLIWTIALVKENLWEYVQQNELMETPIQVFGELEILQLVGQFFDRAQYYAAVGYERARSAKYAEEAHAVAMKG